MKDLSFPELIDYIASIQYSIIAPCKHKLEVALRWCAANKIPLTAINVCGGVSCNSELRKLLLGVADSFDLPLIYSPPALSTDNAAMIAWMGWELMNAEQDVDIRDVTVNALKKIPLGSYVEGMLNVGKVMQSGINKVMTRVKYEQKVSIAVKQGKMSKQEAADASYK